jgi:glucokinase
MRLRTVQSAAEPTYAIGLDIGGTKLAGGVVSSDGSLIKGLSVATPSHQEASGTVALMLRSIEQLRRECPEVAAIGAGAAGMVDWPSGHIRWAPNNGYKDLPLREILIKETGLPVVVDNDANVAAWGEMRIGAGAGYGNLAVLTVGTGIGAGLVLDGKLYRGATGIGGEFGHMIVNPRGATCGCGTTGCLEAMASGIALGRIARQAAAKDATGLMAELAGGPDKVDGKIVFAAAQAGDSIARSLFDEIGYWLGIGIASLVTLLDIQLVIIGGGLSVTEDLLLRPTRSSFEHFVFSRTHRELPRIVLAQLGEEAGVVGAGLLARDRLNDKPESEVPEHELAEAMLDSR